MAHDDTPASRNEKSQSSRRQFMTRTASTMAGAALVPRHVLGGPGVTPPSDRLNVAMIGTGGQGMQNLRNLLEEEDVRIVAIADTAEWADYSRFYHKVPGGRLPAAERIDTRYASQASTADSPGCRVYVDFRRMLDEVEDIDAVVVSTPDHTHAVAAMAAIDRKKHVYIEKPLARTISEVRTLTRAAAEAGVATQLGHQGHGNNGIRLTREWIQDGAIGPVTEVHSWCNGANRSCDGRPGGTPPVPHGLDWDLWLGPAPRVEYHPDYTPCGWRYFWEFGTSKIGDMGSHNMDPAFFALDLGYPEWVQARSAWGDREMRPFVSIVDYQFPARGAMPPVRLTWYEGLMPRRPDELEAEGRVLTGGGNGILFVGEKGKIMCPGWAGNPRMIPETAMRSYSLPPETLPRVGGIYRDWIDACKSGRKASSDWTYSGPFTEAILSGVVAMRVGEGERLYWDWPQMKVTNHPEAEPLVFPEYENGWSL